MARVKCAKCICLAFQCGTLLDVAMLDAIQHSAQHSEPWRNQPIGQPAYKLLEAAAKQKRKKKKRIKFLAVCSCSSACQERHIQFVGYHCRRNHRPRPFFNIYLCIRMYYFGVAVCGLRLWFCLQVGWPWFALCMFAEN